MVAIFDETKFFLKIGIDTPRRHTLWVKNFVEITLSRSVSEINAFLYFQHLKKLRHLVNR